MAQWRQRTRALAAPRRARKAERQPVCAGEPIPLLRLRAGHHSTKLWAATLHPPTQHRWLCVGLTVMLLRCVMRKPSPPTFVLAISFSMAALAVRRSINYYNMYGARAPHRTHTHTLKRTPHTDACSNKRICACVVGLVNTYVCHVRLCDGLAKLYWPLVFRCFGIFAMPSELHELKYIRASNTFASSDGRKKRCVEVWKTVTISNETLRTKSVTGNDYGYVVSHFNSLKNGQIEMPDAIQDEVDCIVVYCMKTCVCYRETSASIQIFINIYPAQ